MRCALILVVLASCYRDAVVAPPPAPRAEATIERPGFVWVRGHYLREHGRYRWHPGYYVRERPDYVYVEGRWERHDAGYAWVDGRWRRRADITIR